MRHKLDRIQDEELRASLAEAHAALRSGDYATVVRGAAAAYAELLRRRPELLRGEMRVRSLLFFPRLGARLFLDRDDRPTVVYDRETFSFSEATTYLEFAADSLIKNGL